jgi:hypothetical protein
MVLAELGALNSLGGCEDRREWGPQLVRHDVHELGFHPVELHQLDHVGPLRLEQSGIGDGSRRLLRE